MSKMESKSRLQEEDIDVFEENTLIKRPERIEDLG